MRSPLINCVDINKATQLNTRRSEMPIYTRILNFWHERACVNNDLDPCGMRKKHGLQSGNLPFRGVSWALL
jgi:hypothetical protein